MVVGVLAESEETVVGVCAAALIDRADAVAAACPGIADELVRRRQVVRCHRERGAVNDYLVARLIDGQVAERHS